MLPIQTLLPLTAINIILRFSATAQPQVFHQPALTAFIRHLSGCGENYDKYFTLDAPESGQTHYEQGDEYTFTLICLAGGERYLQNILEQLKQLPFSAPISDSRSPFRNNLRFARASDFFNGTHINNIQDCIEYDDDKLTAETHFWQQQNQAWCIRYLSPARLLVDKAQRTGKGEKRYCRTENDLQPELLSSRLYQSIADLLRRRGEKTPAHKQTPELIPQNAHLLWFDFNYFDARGKRKPMGGMSGKLCFSTTQTPPKQWLKLLVLGQYLGIGQRRAFGWGHYQLESVTGESTYQSPTRNTSPLPKLAADENTIQPAPKTIKAKQKEHPEKPQQQNESLQHCETNNKNPIGTIDDDGTLLVITGKSTHLSQRNKRLVLIRDNEKITEVPYSQLQSVLLIGTHHITTPAIRGLLRENIPVHFTSTTGRYQGTLWSGNPASTGHQLWLRQQQRCMDEAACLQAAISLVEARLRHQQEVIRQYDTNPERPLSKTRNAFTAALQKLSQVQTLAELNGIEGSASRAYYAAFRQLIPENYGFDGRNRRPPRDPFNVLLSLGYTLLYTHTESLLRVDGLLPWTGFYHQSHGRHAALASDLMEPFRHIIERLALATVRRKIIKPEDFSHKDAGIWMNEAARKRWLGLIEERFTAETTALGDTQADTLHQHLHKQNRRLIQWIDDKSPFHAWRMR